MKSPQNENEDVDIFKNVRLPCGLSHISEVVAVIKDTIDQANAEREEPTVNDDINSPKGE